MSFCAFQHVGEEHVFLFSFKTNSVVFSSLQVYSIFFDILQFLEIIRIPEG